MSKKKVSALVVAVVLLVGSGWVAEQVARPTPPAAAGTTIATASAPVARTDVRVRDQLSGVLGYSGAVVVSYAGAPGIVTTAPAAGQTLVAGDVVFTVKGRPNYLIYGSVPAWRNLSASATPGVDVVQLQHFLVASGMATSSVLRADGRFGPRTVTAVKRWQRRLRQPVTGRLDLGSVTFLHGATRVAAVNITAGQLLSPGGSVLNGTGLTQVVAVEASTGSQQSLRPGTPVLLSLPDGTNAPGHVLSVGRVATAGPTDGSSVGNGAAQAAATIPVTIGVDRRGFGAGLDQAPVSVAITTQEHHQVLAVPVTALQAIPGGGYAVTLSDTPSRAVRVTLGLFDDTAGVVEISGSGISPGVGVQVPVG